MKYIEKHESPQELEDWRTRKNYTDSDFARITNWSKKNKKGKIWKDFTKTGTNGVNGIVKSELKSEQGNICCYCQNRLLADETQIEHLKPRSIYPSKMFDYKTNMMASCFGGERDPKPKESHCGAHKEDDLLLINPLQMDCSSKFRYADDGSIYGVDTDAKEAISLLNLDCKKLENLRESAINGFLADDLTEEDLAELIKKLAEKDENEEFIPFCQIIQNVIHG